MKSKSAVWFCLLLGSALGTGHAWGAASAESVRKSAEASMLVTGTVEINPDGSLHGFDLDQPEKLPAPVIDVINKSLPHWSFKLSAPTTEVVRSKMSLRILAKPMGDGKYGINVAGASFGDDNGQSDEYVRFKSRAQPHYPTLAVDARVSGTVYLLLRIGRDGTVQEAIAEQVNLDQYGTKNEMTEFRKVLARASLAAAKEWTYNLPARGQAINDPYWVVRVPVNFHLNEAGKPIKEHVYGAWDAYIPGPRQSAPWVSQKLLSEAPDAMSDNGLHTGDASLQLMTPLGGT